MNDKLLTYKVMRNNNVIKVIEAETVEQAAADYLSDLERFSIKRVTDEENMWVFKDLTTNNLKYKIRSENFLEASHKFCVNNLNIQFNI